MLKIHIKNKPKHKVSTTNKMWNINVETKNKNHYYKKMTTTHSICSKFILG